LTNGGGFEGGRNKSIARVVLGGVVVLAGIAVVGGGIVLFLSALFG